MCLLYIWLECHLHGMVMLRLGVCLRSFLWQEWKRTESGCCKCVCRSKYSATRLYGTVRGRPYIQKNHISEIHLYLYIRKYRDLETVHYMQTFLVSEQPYRWAALYQFLTLSFSIETLLTASFWIAYVYLPF